jgi:glucose/arabinose dehydrogenase
MTPRSHFRVAIRIAAGLFTFLEAWSGDPIRTGPAAFTDYRSQRPGVSRRITVADLPGPGATASAANGPRLVRRPAKAWPLVPPGFKVQLFASGLDNPRMLRCAPNGDVFLAESRPGRIKVLRGMTREGTAERVEVFADGLRQPFGIAFQPPGPDPRWIYIGDTDQVLRIPYRNGDLKARGAGEPIAALPGGGLLRGGGHWTRDLAFSLDGRTLFVSVGSRSNADDSDGNPAEFHRAAILACDPDGTGLRVHAWGLRNPVSLAVQPGTGVLWTSVNERDDLGDDLPPDYITRVQENGFYGWPWYYIGGHQDPRHPGKRPDLKDRVLVPDVLIQPHNASLGMVFYDGRQFPPEYRGDIFAAEHGSWNRAVRTGYELIRVPLHQRGQATGEYEDFMTGFVTGDGNVWGRPVAVAVAQDGSLLVSDDAGGCLWRISRE